MIVSGHGERERETEREGGRKKNREEKRKEEKKEKKPKQTTTAVDGSGSGEAFPSRNTQRQLDAPLCGNRTRSTRMRGRKATPASGGESGPPSHKQGPTETPHAQEATSVKVEDTEGPPGKTWAQSLPGSVAGPAVPPMLTRARTPRRGPGS